MELSVSCNPAFASLGTRVERSACSTSASTSEPFCPLLLLLLLTLPAPTLSTSLSIAVSSPPTDLYYDACWAAQRAMDAPRPKRIRAQVNYADPAGLDDEIAAPAVAASDAPSSDTEIVASDINPDSDSDEEFTTDKVSHPTA